MRGDRNKTDKGNKRKKHNSKIHKSAITEDCKRENHVVDWNINRIIATKDKCQWCIREAMEILIWGPETMNWDEDPTCARTPGEVNGQQEAGQTSNIS